MKTLDIDGLPEPVAEAVTRIVQTLREHFAATHEHRPPVDLPRWPGKVLGSLRREEMYKDAG